MLEVKGNMKNKETNVICVACEENEERNEETQEYIYIWKFIKNYIDIKGDIPNLNEIFENKQNTEELNI